MQKLFRFIFVLLFVVLIHTTYFILHTTDVNAQAPIPELLLSCSESKPNEFHSLRPYQAAPCGNAPQALFCSNKLVVFEDFDLSNRPECLKLRKRSSGKFDCKLDYHVGAHDINITLDKSEFPIMGNTEDEFDDATKLNEYASWYLNGVIDKKENTEATDDQIVNFSGPLRKLAPSIIQDYQRIQILKSYKDETTYTENDAGSLGRTTEAENHDQLVVDNLRLSDWEEGSLSSINDFFNWIGTDIWEYRFPPLPWQFKEQILYQKAYYEWQGKNCAILPLFGLQCLDTWVSDKWAELWHFVPLSNNSDQKGKNYLLTGDGPSYVPSKGTEIDKAMHKSYRNAYLYFAHTREVNDLSSLLNKTYTPQGYESEKLPETTEQLKKGVSTKANDALARTLPTGDKNNNTVGLHDPYGKLDCSAVNVRVNEGDNLFPGDKTDNKELYVEGIEYDITNVECTETFVPATQTGCGPTINGVGILPCNEKWDLSCNAEVGVEFKLGTKTPYAEEIFSNTVADSGSTFRKIFPKVEEGAPVECIADIPTTTNVTYALENTGKGLKNGTQELKQTKYPADGGGSGTELTFAHIGSVYEYFLKGIQTALRPKGYGEPIANGNCKPSTPVECGDWEEKLEGSGGNCGICTSGLGNLAKKILATAGKQYNVPAASIWAAMKHEGGDWDEFRGQFTDENVRKWSTPIACGGEAMPGCDENDKSSSKSYAPFGHLPYWFYKGDGAGALWTAVQEFDESRNSIDKVSHCNFLDATFAAAKNLSLWSGYSRTPTSCYGFDLSSSTSPNSCGQTWTDAKIVQSHVGYWIGTTPWCPDGSGGPIPAGLGSNVAIPDYASRVLSDFKSAKCN